MLPNRVHPTTRPPEVRIVAASDPTENEAPGKGPVAEIPET